MGGQIARCPALARGGRVGSDGAEGLNECGTFALGYGHDPTIGLSVGVPTYDRRVARLRSRVTAYVFAAAVAGVGGHLLGAPSAWSVAIAVVAPAVLVATPGFLCGAIIGAVTPRPGESGTAATMSGTQFEDYVAQVARSCGVSVIMTPLTGDWGVDIIVGHRPHRLAIQCKRRSRPVGAGAVQEVVAGAPMHGCTKTMVVTNHEFTPAARKLAELHGCELVGRAELSRLRATIGRLTAPTEVS